MRRKLTALTLALVLILALTACAAPAPEPAVEPSPAPAASPAVTDKPEETPEPQSGFPVTVTDAAGREVTIEEEPQSLVSGYYITTSMLIALGQKDKLAGIEAKADTRPIYSLAAPELLELPNVGTAKSFDLEGCAALKPDLIILPIKLKDNVPALEELGLTVLLVNPESLEQLNDTIELLGKACGALQAAEALINYNSDTEVFLSETLSGTESPTVYLAGNSSYLSTAGAAMYQNTLLELGGGKNAAAGLTDDYWAEISYEQLLAWNPEVIIIASDAAYTKDELLSDPQLAQLGAVVNGKVYAMPSAVESWDSPVPGAMVGSRWIASVLHEDVYPFDSFTADANEFYRDFYGITIDPGLLSK